MRFRISAKTNALVVVSLLAVLAISVFHVARLPMRPFGLDPCDAVAHFAFLALLLIAGISFMRAFLPRMIGLRSSEDQLYLNRSQQAFVIAVSTWLAADLVDLVRHPSVWVNSAARNQMLAWLAAYPAIAITMQWLIQNTRPTTMRKNAKDRVAIIAVATIAVLFVCPEYGIDYSSETAHILTVVVGGLVLLVPMRLLLPVLVPQASSERYGGRALFATRREWGVLAIGVALFSPAFVRQLQNFRPFPYVHPALMIGLIGALFIAYAFLAEPLGFTRDPIRRVDASR